MITWKRELGLIIKEGIVKRFGIFLALRIKFFWLQRFVNIKRLFLKSVKK